MPPKVEIEVCHFHENDWVAGGKRWKTASLIQAARDQGCEEFDLPLSAVDLCFRPFDAGDMDGFIYHANRVNLTNLDYPIIIDWFGRICDGWHRIAKAILEGRETVRAVRLKRAVEPDFIEREKADDS